MVSLRGGGGRQAHGGAEPSPASLSGREGGGGGESKDKDVPSSSNSSGSGSGGGGSSNNNRLLSSLSMIGRKSTSTSSAGGRSAVRGSVGSRGSNDSPNKYSNDRHRLRSSLGTASTGAMTTGLRNSNSSSSSAAALPSAVWRTMQQAATSSPPSSQALSSNSHDLLLSARIAQEMAAVMDVDDDWDRHQKIQRALQRHNFTINKLRFNELELCGREKELNEIKDVFQRVVVAIKGAESSLSEAPTASTNSAAATRRGSSSKKLPSRSPKVAVVNVVGRSGTGKTRLCQELKATVVGSSIRNHRGFFLEGKFDLQNRQEPFTGLVAAMASLEDQVMARGDAFAMSLAEELGDAIGGGDSRVLTTVVPGLEDLMAIRTNNKVAAKSTEGETGAGANVVAPRDSGFAADVKTAHKDTAESPNDNMEEDHEGVGNDGDDDDKLTTRSTRLQYLFRQLFKCICRPSHPVVLLLDDMQWSDESTLSLLSTLLTDPDLSSFMVLATCREEEADGSHPWNVLLNNLQAQHAKKVAVRHVPLSNLDQPAVLNIVQTSLRCSEERTFRLAEIVHTKSSGNAMYVIHFLTSLYEDGLLRYNVGSMSWMWDEASVRSRFVTDNVVDLTTAKLQRLPTQLRTLLMMAACLGRTFDRSKLELIRSQPRVHDLLGSTAALPSSKEVEEVGVAVPATAMETENLIGGEGAVQGQDSSSSSSPPPPPLPPEDAAQSPSSGRSAGSGKILPDDEEKGDDSAASVMPKVDWLSASLHRLSEDSVIEYVPQLRSYCFAHDMIQEAAFLLIPEKVRAPVQREVGRALLQSNKLKELDDNSYFRAIELCNVVGSSLADLEATGSASYTERHELAQHNNSAGKRAMAKAAFGKALKYFEAGLQKLDNDARDMDLFLELSCGAVESAFCSGSLEAMEKHMATALTVETAIENKVRVYLTRILSYGAQDKNSLAIATGRQVLIQMGITRLPRRPGTHHVVSELLKTKWVMRNHTEHTLMALPTLENKRWLQAMSIIDMMQAVAYCSDMNLFAVMNLRMLRWTVRFGVCRFTPTVLATYGVVLCQIGELQSAQPFGAASMLISDRLNATASRSKTIICAYALVAPWQAPYRSVFKMLQYGHKLGMKTGELEIAMYNLAQYNFALVATSAMPLKAFIPKIRSDNKLMREYGQDGVRNFGLLMTQYALNLVGPVDHPVIMTGAAMDEEYFRSTYTSVDHLLLIGWLNTCCLKLAYYFGDYDRADECSRNTEDFAKVAGGHPYVYRHAFFSSLTAFAVARQVGASGGHRSRRRATQQLRRAMRFARQIQKWSDAGNVNCSHLTQLLEAERLSFVKGKEAAARRLYSAAITTAQKNGYLNDKALAHELAFSFHWRLATREESCTTSTMGGSSKVTARSSPPDEDWFWARHHYKDAVEAYCDWNAFQKAKQLVDTHGTQFKLTAAAFTSLTMMPDSQGESGSGDAS